MDLFVGNIVSGGRASELLQDASECGIKACNGLHTANDNSRHAARNLKRRLCKLSLWPKDYMATIRTWDPKSQAERQQSMAFLLPHEVLRSLVLLGDIGAITDRSGMDPLTLQHLEYCEKQAASELPMVALGLWGDAAPCNWDREESLQVYSFNLPGLAAEPWRGLRIPFTGLSSRHMGPNTHSDIMAVFAWSMKQLAVGLLPTSRHDNEPWHVSDKLRAELATNTSLVGKTKLPHNSVGCVAALCECRQDWKHLKECFKFQGWLEVGGICHLCNCTAEQVREVGENASWRQPSGRLSHYEFLQRSFEQGLDISPIFSAPWVTTKIFKYDWLHAVDLGVAADMLGQIFDFFIRTKGLAGTPGKTIAARCKALWLDIQLWYKAQKVTDKLQNLTPAMIRRSNQKWPKLRCSAAQARALVPYAAARAQQWLDATILEHRAIQTAAYHLNQCYLALSRDSIFWEGALAANSRKYALQIVALEAHELAREANEVARWRVKPKLHAFLELCSDGSQPSLFWTYRDEDWGGSASRFARRRGGLQSPQITSKNLLFRFRCKTAVPRIR